MAKGINKAIILGRLGSDPEVRHTPGGSTVANFSVATSRSWKNKDGENVDETEWHRIVAWGRLAEICKEYLRKGSQIYLEGRIQTRDWEDQNGQKRYTTEIVMNEMQMLGGSSGGGGSMGGGMGSNQGTSISPPADPGPSNADDVPF